MTLAERRITLLLCAGLGLAAGAALLLAPSALLGILILPALLAAVWLVRGAAHESRLAVFVILFLAVFLLDATFRTRDYAEKGVEFQVLLKIGIWRLITIIAPSRDNGFLRMDMDGASGTGDLSRDNSIRRAMAAAANPGLVGPARGGAPRLWRDHHAGRRDRPGQ
jgi:hypothetical protein